MKSSGFGGFSSGFGSGFGSQKNESLIKETMTLAEVAKLQNDSIPKQEEKKDATAPATTPAATTTTTTTGATTTGTNLFGSNANNTSATKTNMFGSSTFSFGKSGSAGSTASSANQNNDFIYAGSILYGLIKVANEFQKDNTPLEGVDAFEKRLANIEESATKAYVHTVMTLASEIDHGNTAIAEYRSLLETARRDYTLALRPKHSTSPFLQRYVDSIQKRGKILEDSIDSFDKALDFDDNARSSQSLRDVLIQQQEAIIRCSSKLSEIKERASEIQKEVVMKLKSNGMDASEIEKVESDEVGISRASIVKEEYEQFLQNRKRDLEKHDLNEEKYKKPEQKSSGFSFGSGLFGNKQAGK